MLLEISLNAKKENEINMSNLKRAPISKK